MDLRSFIPNFACFFFFLIRTLLSVKKWHVKLFERSNFVLSVKNEQKIDFDDLTTWDI